MPFHAPLAVHITTSLWLLHDVAFARAFVAWWKVACIYNSSYMQKSLFLYVQFLTDPTDDCYPLCFCLYISTCGIQSFLTCEIIPGIPDILRFILAIFGFILGLSLSLTFHVFTQYWMICSIFQFWTWVVINFSRTCRLKATSRWELNTYFGEFSTTACH